MNLSQIAVNFKSAVKYLAIGVGILAILWLLWLLMVFIFNLISPPKTEPDIAFGKLPRPFLSNFRPNPDLFTLDTPGNSLPTPPSLLKVYSVPNVEGKFTSLENAKKIASANGLDSDPDKISENEWRFTSKKVPGRSLRYNIVTGNFIYTYDWVADPSSLTGIFKTTDADIIAQARSIVKGFKALKTDLTKSETRISFWKLAGNDRNQVSSYSDANGVMVEIFRDKVEGKYPVVEGNPARASVNVLISPTQKTEKKLLELNYTYWEYDDSNIGTYPPKSPSEAFAELKDGEAFVTVGLNEAFEKIDIVEVTLSYFNPMDEIRYFQPIYVFKGEGLIKNERKEFIAYVPAVSSSYQQ
jgi:hypothetical protein